MKRYRLVDLHLRPLQPVKLSDTLQQNEWKNASSIEKQDRTKGKTERKQKKPYKMIKKIFLCLALVSC